MKQDAKSLTLLFFIPKAVLRIYNSNIVIENSFACVQHESGITQRSWSDTKSEINLKQFRCSSRQKKKIISAGEQRVGRGAK